MSRYRGIFGAFLTMGMLVPGSEGADAYTPSSKGIKKELDRKDEIRMATGILETTGNFIFPQKLPERKSGHKARLLDGKGKRLALPPIDWDRLLSLDHPHRNRVARIMAYSEMMRKSGVSKDLIAKLQRDFKLPLSRVPKIRRELAEHFQDRKKASSEGSMVNYFNFLSILKKNGLKTTSTDRDLVSILYQMEVIEDLVENEKYESPKKEFQKRIALEMEKIEKTGDDFKGGEVDILEKDIAKKLPHIKRSNSVGSSHGLGAEFVNSVFWSLVDYDPRKATTFLEQLGTMEKHTSLGTFMLTQKVMTPLVDGRIPLKMKKAHFFGYHGVNMASAMVASEVVYRAVYDDNFSDSVSDMLTGEFAAELYHGRSGFMAGTAAVDAAAGVWRKATGTSAGCPTFLKNWGRMSMIFLSAEVTNRSSRPVLEASGLLGKAKNDQIQLVSTIYHKDIEPLRELLGKNEVALSEWKKLQALFDEDEIRKNLTCQMNGKKYSIENSLSKDDIFNKCEISLKDHFQFKNSKAKRRIDQFMEETDKILLGQRNIQMKDILGEFRERTQAISKLAEGFIKKDLDALKEKIFFELSVRERHKKR